MKLLRAVGGLVVLGAIGGGMVEAKEGKEGAAAAEVNQLIEKFDQAVDDHYALIRKAPKEKRQELYEQMPDGEPVVEKIREFIKEFPGNDEVPASAAWVLRRMRSDPFNPEDIYQALGRHHLDHPKMPLAAMSTLYDSTEMAERFLDGVAERTKTAEVKGAVAMVRAYKIRHSPEPDEEKRIEYLRIAAANLGDLEIRGRSMKASAEGELFAAEHLQIGKVAPEIEGEDTAGVKFKLSDYRGKVVVIDFWGHW